MAKKGAKPKYDYEGKDFLEQVEQFAKKGFTDKEIAYSLGLNPAVFATKKSHIPKLYNVLASARHALNSIVRAKFLSMALGGTKTKSRQTRKIKDEKGNITSEEEVMENETELPPSLQAMSVWLYHYDEDWRKVERKQDEDANGIPTDVKKGVDITDWIKKEVEE